MNKRNSNNLPPRRFPKQQYTKLTHKIGLAVILPIAVILIGGGIGVTCYHLQQRPAHHTYRVMRQHKHVNQAPAKRTHVNHIPHLKVINVKQGEHLLGHWLRKLNYPADKSQSILTTYQKQNEDQDLKASQKLNQLVHSNVNSQKKTQQIRHFINKEF